MVGTSKHDEMYGRGGGDTMYGLDSPADDNDYMDGGDGSDKLYGGPGSDVILGKTGSDKLYGGAGVDRIGVGPTYRDDLKDDYVHGGKNKDFLGSGGIEGTVQSGVERIYGDEEDDRIDVSNNAGPEDSAKDVVTCGPGTDTVWFNEGVDIVDASCEIKNPQ
jgi:hypothetical protein